MRCSPTSVSVQLLQFEKHLFNKMVRPVVSNAIGIDLGTTNCCVGFLQNGSIKIIPNLVTEERTTPSYVFFQEKRVHVGKIAMANSYVSPENVVYGKTANYQLLFI